MKCTHCEAPIKESYQCLYCEQDFCEDCEPAKRHDCSVKECDNCAVCHEYIPIEIGMMLCPKCKLYVCTRCVAMTWCQTIHGICKKCFDYKCVSCGVADLSDKIMYVEDSGLDEVMPLCAECLKNET